MDFEKIAQFLEIMNMFMEEPAAPAAGAPPNIASPGPNARGIPPMTAFGEPQTGSPELSMMKEALPYMDYRYQRSMAMMLKLSEIQRLMEEYGAQARAGGDASWRPRLLMSIRAYVAEDRRYMIDLLLKLMEIREILDCAGRYREQRPRG